MKRILFGLMGIVSIMAFSKQLDITEPTKSDTNIWRGGQRGKIIVKGKLISAASAVKYLVYAGDDKGTVREHELILPELVITNFDEKADFENKPDDIYIKRISNDKIVDLEPEDKLKLAVGYQDGEKILGYTKKSQPFSITNLMKTPVIEKMMEIMGDGYTKNEYNIILNKQKARVVPNTTFVFTVEDDKKITVKTAEADAYGDSGLTFKDKYQFMRAISEGRNIEFPLYIKMN